MGAALSRTALFTTGALLALILLPEVLTAGFGITPPYVRNHELTRSSVYEQRIMMVRSSPDLDMLASITVDVPGANDWITIVSGDGDNEVVLPAGERRVPLVVRLEIPDNARYDDYTGNIRIRTRPLHEDDRRQSGVSIALGAQIDVNLSVTDLVIREFEIRRTRVSDLNEGRTVWWLEYPGKMRVAITLKNTGNVPVAPDRVEVDIYDARGEELLERTNHTNTIERVDPFDTKEIVAHLPTRLPAGSYRARYRIYNDSLDDPLVHSGESSFNIRDGDVEDDTGYGFMGLSLWHKFTLVGPIMILIVSIFSFVATPRRALWRLLWLKFLAVRYVIRFVRNLGRAVLGKERVFRRR